MIFGLFRKSVDRARVNTIYSTIVAQARQPVFYAEFGVPDTLEGRYEMLMLHAFLYLHRVQNETPEVRNIAQEVFDFMFGDMDRSLRELGVGDLSVPKKIKKMAQAFYGRTAAYDDAIGMDGNELPKAVQRNVFGDDPAAETSAEAVARYMRQAVKTLAGQSVDALTTTGPVFPQPVPPAQEKTA